MSKSTATQLLEISKRLEEIALNPENKEILTSSERLMIINSALSISKRSIELNRVVIDFNKHKSPN